jgi:transposase-like protein
MAQYSPERKGALLKKLLPPFNMSVAALARQEGIAEQTLYSWRYQAKAHGVSVPGNKRIADEWSSKISIR